MADLTPRYTMHDGFGPTVEYDPPNETLGMVLSDWNNPLQLEYRLAHLEGEPDAYVSDNATRADRAGELIEVSGDWSDEVLVLPFTEFHAAAAGFLEWMRSQPPPIRLTDMRLVVAGWLGGTITTREASGVMWTPDRDDPERHLHEWVARVGPLDAQATLEKAAWAVAHMVTNCEVDPRYGAATIAALAARLDDPDTECARLMQPFTALTAEARAAEGQPELVATLEHRIDAAAEELAAARAGPFFVS
jgi:hypothetical protein